MLRIAAALLATLFLAGFAEAEPLATNGFSERLAPRTLGDENASVRIDEYFALDCPVCAEFYAEIFPTLKSDYIDKGRVKIVMHDFPVHSLSVPAAMLARRVSETAISHLQMRSFAPSAVRRVPRLARILSSD